MPSNPSSSRRYPGNRATVERGANSGNCRAIASWKRATRGPLERAKRAGRVAYQRIARGLRDCRYAVESQQLAQIPGEPRHGRARRELGKLQSDRVVEKGHDAIA